VIECELLSESVCVSGCTNDQADSETKWRITRAGRIVSSGGIRWSAPVIQQYESDSDKCAVHAYKRSTRTTIQQSRSN
jgi:hypothetical protein